jgi:hypothetical protein
MIEVIAAIAGASISVAAMGAFGVGKRNDEARDAVIRLTTSVEHIATQLEANPHRHARSQPRNVRPPQSRRATGV